MKLLRYLCLLISLSVTLASQAQFNPVNPPEPGNDRYYKVTLTSTPSVGGSVSASPQQAKAGDNVYISASPRTGYRFVEWLDAQGNRVSTSTSYLFTMPQADVAYQAIFSYSPTNPSEPDVPKTYVNVSVSADPAQGGTVSGGGRFAVGDRITVNASPRSGYRFTGWTRDGQSIGTSSYLYYTVLEEDNNLTAHFRYSPTDPSEPEAPKLKGTLTLKCEPSNAGTFNTSAVSQYAEGQSVYLSVNPRSNYKFTEWVDSKGNVVSTSQRFYYTMPSGHETLTARLIYSPTNPSEPDQPAPKRNILYGAREQSIPGSGFIYSIILENVDALNGLNVDLTIPDGLVFDVENAILSSRTDGHTLSYTEVGENTYRFQVRGTTAIAGANGAIIRIPVTIPADAEVGNTIVVPVSKGVIYRTDGTQDPADTANGAVKITARPEEIPDSPDFIVSNVTADNVEVMPGDPVTVSWTVENIGSINATGGWSESVFLVDENGGRTMLGTVYYDTEQFGTGQVVARTATFNIPALPALSGKLNAGVALTPYTISGELEQFQGNNTTIGENYPVLLGKRLVVEMPATATEGTDNNIRIRVTRSGSWAETETFNIRVLKEDARLTVPSSVTIPANQGAVYFQVTLTDNDSYEGDTFTEIEIEGNYGYESATGVMQIQDDEMPALTLDASSMKVTEGDIFTLTVTLPMPATRDLTFTLSCDYPERFNFGRTVTVKSGETTADVEVTVVDNNTIDGNHDVTFIIEGDGYESAEEYVTLHDNDIPDLEFTIKPSEVSEGDGPTAMRAVITRTNNFDKKVTIVISDNSKTGELLYPTNHIELAVNQRSAEFTIGILDNAVVDGDREVTVTAAVYISSCSCSAVGENGGNVSHKVKILDNDCPALSLGCSVSVIPEGDEGILLTLSRNTDTSMPLTVTLSSDADDRLEYDHMATFPTGAREIYIRVKAPANDEEGDTRTVIFTAEAEGYTKSTLWLMVADQSLPDAVITQIGFSESSIKAGEPAMLKVTVKNAGAIALPEQTCVTVYLTNKPLVKLYTQHPLMPGESVELTRTVQLPKELGTFDVYAVVNEDKSVQEILYTNNTSLHTHMEVTAPYVITQVSVGSRILSPGESVVISGKAEGRFDEGEMIEVYVINNGARQTLSTPLKADGSFSTDFTPYASQKGHFTIGACCPGENLRTEMTGFDIYGLTRASSVATTCEGIVGEVKTVIFGLTNPTALPLTGVKSEVTGMREGCIVKADVPPTIAANSTANVVLTFNASVASAGSDWETLILKVTSTEGATCSETVYYYFRNPAGVISTDLTSIEANISMGTTMEVPVTITNTGAGATGRIKLALPEWIRTVTSGTIPSLGSEESLTIPLIISTNEKMHLNMPLTGTIGVNCENGHGLAISYSITPVTDEKGFVKVEACDEYTYYTAERPKVSGATVIVKHPSTGNVIVSEVTDENGTVTIELPGGYYQVEVTADKHDTYSQFFFISPGKTETVTADISYNPITITWDVKETEIEDEYVIETITKYETNVPMPVVKITIPKRIDGDNMAVGDATLINMNLTNVGLIKALDVRVLVPQDQTEWLFEPLTHTEPFELAAHESVNVPIRITRIADVSMQQSPRRNVAIGIRSAADDMYDSFNACMAHLAANYNAICGKELKNNTSAENMSMKACATAATMATIMTQLNRLLQYLPHRPSGPWNNNYLGHDRPGGDYFPHGPSTSNNFSICDPCDAERAERIINRLVGHTWLSGFWEMLDNVLQMYRDQGRRVRTVIRENTADRVGDMIQEGVLGEANDIANVIVEIVEITAPCEDEDGDGTGEGENAPAAPGMRAPRASDRGWQKEFDATAESFIEVLRTMDRLLLASYGDRVWFEDMDEEKVNFLQYVKLLTDMPMPTDEEIMDHKPASVSFQQCKEYVELCFGIRDSEVSDETFEKDMDDFIRQADEAESRGYSNYVTLFDDAYNDYVDNFERMKSESVCASITLKLTQHMTLTRQAFRGSLSVFNGHDSKPMKDVRLNLLVRDDKGNVATSREFQINLEDLKGFGGEASLDSDWTLEAGSTGDASILFIPSKYAAPETPQVYSFGGSLTYVDPYTDLTVTRTLYPVSLTVKPSPSLNMTYFMQRDVYADDPLTPDVIEPTYPAEFAVVINNTGYGDAENVRMVTEQPEIIYNEKGLLIDFEIESSQLNGEEKMLSLGNSIATDFGTIAANSSVYAQWWLKSTLLGHFTEYSVEATHITSYGNPDLSLLDKVEIHELIHGMTIADDELSVPGQKRRAFIVNDIQDADDLPDMVYFSDSSDACELASEALVAMRKISDTVYELDITPEASGWIYGVTSDLTASKRALVGITRRSDGAMIPTDNVWQTAVTLRDGKEPIHESRIHVAGYFSGSDTYVLTFETGPEKELEVVQFAGVKQDELIYSSLKSLTVSFNKAVDAATFTTDDLRLTLAGEPCELESVTIEAVNSTDFRINLGDATLADGYYVLTVRTDGITDTEGFTGSTGKSISWIQVIDGKVMLTIKKEPADGGTVTPGSMRVDLNSVVKLSATPAEGYEFTEWRRGDLVYSTDSIIEHEMTADEIFTAIFSRKRFNVTVEWNPLHGYVTDGESGIYEYGDELQLTAVANTGYCFSHWLIDDVAGSESSQLSLIVKNDTRITALFRDDIATDIDANVFYGFIISPTIVHDLMTVSGSFTTIKSLTVFNSTGMQLRRWSDVPCGSTINIPELPEGFLIVHAVTDNGVYVRKLLKR